MIRAVINGFCALVRVARLTQRLQILDRIGAALADGNHMIHRQGPVGRTTSKAATAELIAEVDPLGGGEGATVASLLSTTTMISRGKLFEVGCPIFATTFRCGFHRSILQELRQKWTLAEQL